MQLTPTFLDGAVLALATLPDVDAVVDTHRCELERAFKNDVVHDYRSRLTGKGPFARDRRVFAIKWDRARDATGTEEELRKLLLEVGSRHPDRPIVVLRGLISMLVGTDVEGIALSLAGTLPNPLLVVEQTSCDEDWTEGWRAVHDAVLSHLVAEDGDRSPVVTGHWMHRLEGDEAGNVGEIRRLLAAVGVPEPRWPFSGGPVAAMKIHPQAPRIIFPHGGVRSANGRGKPADAGSVEVPAPMGFEATGEMLRRVATRFGGEESVERLVESQRQRLRLLLEPLVARCLAGRAVVVVEEPIRAVGLCAMLRELSVDVPWVVLLRRRGARCPEGDELQSEGIDVLRDPEMQEVRERLTNDARNDRVDAVVGSGLYADVASELDLPTIETGYPFHLEHFCADTPFMGFEGLVRLADRLGNAVMTRKHRTACRRSTRTPTD